MTSQLTTLDPVPATTHAKTILAKDGFHCSLIMLSPGEETSGRAAAHASEHILFVVEGEATVRFEDTNTILGKDQALLIPKGREHTIAAHPGGSARILRVEIPARQVVTPPILSFGR